ncbi:MAG: electron transfer flavoprotein subunit beta/FixA family protein [Endomicrobium sp.]|jgi:electron transfer flavoprotein beta subunit|nr:electron transfer flavoprotein subunit beta/FixA family protein [Endomicrobium sp.]
MNIIVCIKQIINSIINQESNNKRYGLNPFDEYALEESLKVKDMLKAKIIVITMGTPDAEFILRYSISKGVDEAILLTDNAFKGSDTLATAYTLFKAIKLINNYNLILCGKQSPNGNTGFVGPELAEMLNIPHITCVKRIKSINNTVVIVDRLLDIGSEVLESKLPVLLTITKGDNISRLVSVKGRILARKASIKIWDMKFLNMESNRTGSLGSNTHISKKDENNKQKNKEIFTGNASSIAVKIVDKLLENKII